MITLKIDVLKIDKDRLYKGEKCVYLDAVMIETPDNKFGDDYMIVQSVTKEENKAGVRGNILGNARIFVKKSDVDSQVTESDDLPF